MDNKYRVPIVGEDNIYNDIQFLKHRIKKVKKGTVLYPDDLEDTILCIIKGKLKFVIGNDIGEEKIVHYIDEKSFCAPFLPEVVDVLSVRLIAEEDSELAYYNKIEMFDYVNSNKGMFEKFLKDLGKRQAVMYCNVLDILYETSRNRVYCLIYQMALNNKKEDGVNIQIDNFPSKSDISLITGVHRSNVYKYITDLENKGIIEKVKHSILVKDIRELEILIREGSKNKEICCN